MGNYWSNGHLESTGSLMKLSLLQICLLEMRITRIKNHIKEICSGNFLQISENIPDSLYYCSAL